MCIAIYEFDGGYVVHGELEIVKLSSMFEMEWRFLGRDIFVSSDGDCPFEIKGNKIYVVDWLNIRYEIDRFGNDKVVS